MRLPWSLAVAVVDVLLLVDAFSTVDRADLRVVRRCCTANRLMLDPRGLQSTSPLNQFHTVLPMFAPGDAVSGVGCMNRLDFGYSVCRVNIRLPGRF